MTSPIFIHHEWKKGADKVDEVNYQPSLYFGIAHPKWLRSAVLWVLKKLRYYAIKEVRTSGRWEPRRVVVDDILIAIDKQVAYVRRTYGRRPDLVLMGEEAGRVFEDALFEQTPFIQLDLADCPVPEYRGMKIISVPWMDGIVALPAIPPALAPWVTGRRFA